MSVPLPQRVPENAPGDFQSSADAASDKSTRQYTLAERHSLRHWLAMLMVAGLVTGVMSWWIFHRSMPFVPARALDNAEQYELFSLYPRMSEDEFHGHRILGRAPVVDPAMRKRLTEALKKAARDSDGRIMCCFEPRHGIRVISDGKTTDFAICFQCLQVHVFRDGKAIAYVPITNSEAAVFNDAVAKLGLPPAPLEP